uniref:MFS domain-containing protein n=1 Tax=Elaeophora elaphi TaxID=1147741 RepID=A0A0R3S0M7_9BILA
MSKSLIDNEEANLSPGIDRFIVFNRYTIFLCLTYELVIVSQVGNVIYMIFAAASPDIVGCGMTIFNETLSQREACEQYEVLTKFENHSCKPILEYQFRSIGVEWGYFCSETVKVKNVVSFQMFGTIIGGILFGQCSDLFGRKKPLFQTIIICLAMTALSGILSSFAVDLFMFAISRTFVGFFVGGNSIVMYVYVIENIPINARVKVNTFVTWSPNFLVLSLIAYLTGSWDRLAVAVNLLAAPSLLCFIFLYESPRWLMQKGRLNEAKQIIIAMNTWGQSAEKKQYRHAEEVTNALENSHTASRELLHRKRYYFYHLFSSWKLLRYSVVLSFSCFSNAIAFYGLLFNLEKISGSLYMNTWILGAFRYILNIMLATVDHAFTSVGRKFVHTMSIIIFILSMAFIVVLIKTDLSLEFKGLIRILTLTGMGTISILFIVNILSCAELFPTAIRNLASANVSTWNRIGCILAPQLIYLDEIEQSLPYIVLITLLSIDALSFLIFLPETKSRPLKDRMPPKEKLILRSCKATRAMTVSNDDNDDDNLNCLVDK